jgi:hypothetical protein
LDGVQASENMIPISPKCNKTEQVMWQHFGCPAYTLQPTNRSRRCPSPVTGCYRVEWLLDACVRGAWDMMHGELRMCMQMGEMQACARVREGLGYMQIVAAHIALTHYCTHALHTLELARSASSQYSLSLTAFITALAALTHSPHTHSFTHHVLNCSLHSLAALTHM